MAWAAYGGHLDVVQFIYAYMKYNRIPQPYMGAYWAAIGGHVDVLEWMWEEDWTSRQDDVMGYCLMMGSYFNHADVVDYLLGKKASLFYRQSRWIGLNTPDGVLYYKDIGFGSLHAAIQAGHTDMLRTLLGHWLRRHGADGRDPHGMTGLHYSAAGGDVEMARDFIDNGAPVNGQSDIGVTALMFAAEWGHADIVEMLLEAGADKDVVSAYDDTAKTLAEENGHSDIAVML